MFSFESQFIRTDVTAVNIQKSHYLIGVGGYIHVFDKISRELLTKIKIFEGQKIYGIIADKDANKFLLYGSRYLKIITIDSFLQVEENSFQTTADWILSCKWIEDDQQIATVSMHNELQIWTSNLQLLLQIKCEEKCILYSAYICYNNFDQLIILAGTVFSEVLVWRPRKENDSPVQKRLQKHKGVIFSVHYNETSGYICSSSDDRSAILWKPKNKTLLTELKQESVEINFICQVFGHLSRIFRCHVLKECFFTGGEDSLLNIWSFNGELVRKIETHQGGTIWAIDASENDNTILTGGSDGGATLFPINCDFDKDELLLPDKQIPKNVGILTNNNLVVFSETGALHYYLRKTQKWLQICAHDDLKSYALLAVSKCRNVFALAGFYGQIYIYKQEKDELLSIVSAETKIKSRIFSLHWIDCKTFLTCQSEGRITLYLIRNNNIICVTNFILPPSKERWTTTAVFAEKNFIIGDRKGNLHLFEIGKFEPIQTIKKAHSYLGITNLIVENDRLISLGRNAIVNTFMLNKNRLQLISSNKLSFTWLVDCMKNILLAFTGDKFVIWDIINKRIIFEISCGGGHRSWDFVLSNTAVFSYIKDKIIQVVYFNINRFSPIDIIEGYQVKEINSIVTIPVFENYIIVSGGEDTTLRINLKDDTSFKSLVSLKPHLSSIRTLTTHKISSENEGNKETFLVCSGGGRAQVICWKLDIFKEGNRVKNVICSEQHSYYKVIDCDESEMRIMDLIFAKIEKYLLLFAACSDGNIKIFFVDVNEFGEYSLRFCRDVFYKLKCVLKLRLINIFCCDILVTMGTDGKLVFWNISDICENDIKYFHTIQAHQSGINSCDFKLLNDNLCVILTGGDDNMICINLVRFRKSDVIQIQDIDVFRDYGTHCAQITGVFLSDKYFFTASIDQRITIFQWQIIDEKTICKYCTKYNTAVADIQGLSCHFKNNDFDVFVYGKGIEHIKIKQYT